MLRRETFILRLTELTDSTPGAGETATDKAIRLSLYLQNVRTGAEQRFQSLGELMGFLESAATERPTPRRLSGES
jgi:hypothetical protein